MIKEGDIVRIKRPGYLYTNFGSLWRVLSVGGNNVRVTKLPNAFYSPMAHKDSVFTLRLLDMEDAKLHPLERAIYE